MSNVARLDSHRWKNVLTINGKTEAPKPDAGNVFLLLSNGEWKGRLAYDEFGDRFFWARDGVPLESFEAPKAGEDLADHHLTYLQQYFSKIGGAGESGGIRPVTFRTSTIQEGAQAAARKNAVHPLRQYLRALRWDGDNRLARWCNECLGAEQSDYSSSVGTWWMVSAVARALEPGCQADSMLLLIGGQGARKSTALRILGGDWYLPELPDVHSKDAAYVLRGRWIVECGELGEGRRKDEEAARKDFQTRTIDVFRPPYGRNIVRWKRSVVFAGTTNSEYPLSDPTGGRRYWPMKCAAVNAILLAAWRDQLWAEAVHRFELGEQWHPTDNMIASVRQQQEESFDVDPWEKRVLNWARAQKEPFRLEQALGGALNLEPKDWSRSAASRVGAILNRAEFFGKRIGRGSTRERVYERLVIPADDT